MSYLPTAASTTSPVSIVRRLVGVGLRAGLRAGLFACLGLGGAGLALPAGAQEPAWPAAHPIKLVVPFPAGGSTDSVGRLLATEIARELNQAVVVENKAGANGNIGSEQVAKSPADGYTLLLSGIGNAISYSLYKLPYSDASFRHLSLLATGPQVIIVNNELPVRSLQDLVKLAKSKPGALSYASAGSGSGGHLTMELLRFKTGLEMTHVPYKGFGPAIPDLIGGRIEVLALNHDGALPLVNAGKVRALAVTSKVRNPAFPTVPTVAETGVADLEVVSWFGLTAPAALPDAIARRLTEAAQHAMQAPKVQKYLQDAGFVVVGSNAEEFARFVKGDIRLWQSVVKQANVTVE